MIAFAGNSLQIRQPKEVCNKKILLKGTHLVGSYKVSVQLNPKKPILLLMSHTLINLPILIMIRRRAILTILSRARLVICSRIDRPPRPLLVLLHGIHRRAARLVLRLVNVIY